MASEEQEERHWRLLMRIASYIDFNACSYIRHVHASILMIKQL